VQAAEMGYTNLFLYAEGMPVWEESGYPIIKGPNYETKIETAKITPQKLNTLIKSGTDDLIVVDVRDESEYAEGHIPKAINIPVTSFALQSDKLDKGKTIIVYCNAGGRSYMAYRKLMKLGYKKFYQTLFADWKEAGYDVVLPKY
jgi:rhodanese-related sulfurtransferase